MGRLFNILNWVESLVSLCTFNLGGGGDSAPTHTTSTSSNLPEYAKPYYEELLKQTGKQVYSTDAKGNVTGTKEYQPYQGQVRFDDGTQSTAGQRVAGFTEGQRGIQQQVAGLQTPGQFGQAGAGLGVGQGMGFSAANQGFNQAFGYQPQGINAQTISAPSLQNFGMNAAQGSFNPNLQNYQMGPAQNVAAMGIGSQNFGQGAADYYMSPYAQAAINPSLREARLQGDLQKQAGMTGAIGRGTFGGARQALLQAEQERGTQRTMADIQSTGMEKAYQNAQAQFQADQARQLQAQQANQQYGLQAQLANQQAGLTTGQQNLAALLGVQQLGTQTGAQFGLANLSNAQQANVQNLAAQLQTQGLSADQAMKAALANQQSNLQAQQLTQQGQQYAAGLGKDIGLAGLTAGLQSSQAMGQLGTAEQAANLDRLRAQSASAGEEQAMQQKQLDTAYQTEMEQRNYQRSQLEYLSNILRGNAAALGSTQTQYTPAPSMASQIGGLGLAGLGLYKAMG
jgi:hypothetical protein